MNVANQHVPQAWMVLSARLLYEIELYETQNKGDVL